MSSHPPRRESAFVAAALTIGLTAAARADGPLLTAVPIENVTVHDPFFSPKLDTWRRVTIKDALDKFERDGVLENFDRVTRGEKGGHQHEPWFDGLTYEMIRAAADFMRQKPDAALKARLDGWIDHIAAAAAKDPDGYVNTYTQLEKPDQRWGRNGGNERFQHDLYNLACLVEAGVHYYDATGETKLLTTAVKAANGMCRLMGPPPKLNVVPGHAIGEESFVKLARLFRRQPDLRGKIEAPIYDADYLALAKFWLDNRGNHAGRDDFGSYNQDHAPALEQTTIEGHAVRAPLLALGMIAVGHEAGRPEYVTAAKKLWANMVERRMYLTGGVGSFATDEKFGPDFTLPNTGYAETCAAVAGGFFDHSLNLATGESKTADELERVLYNGALAGVSVSGDRYFYENPLQADAKRDRWSWHGCPCCPPMFLKLMGGLPGYIYATDPEGGIYVNQFIGSTAKIDAKQPITLTQKTEYPWQGDVSLTVDVADGVDFDLYVRVPGWTHGEASTNGLYTSTPAGRDTFTISVNGQPVAAPEIVRGYAKLHRTWQKGDAVEVRLAMPVRRVRADARVDADRGRVALARGPVVYCVEGVDNNGRVSDLFLPDDAMLTVEHPADLLGKVVVLKADARRLDGAGDDTSAALVAVPYYANTNRGPTEMAVWLPTTAGGATAPTTGGPAK